MERPKTTLLRSSCPSKPAGSEGGEEGGTVECRGESEEEWARADSEARQRIKERELDKKFGKGEEQSSEV